MIAARHLYMKLSLDHSLYFECFYIGFVDNSLFLSWPPTRQPFLFFSIYILSSSFVASVRSRNLWRHVFVLDTRPLTSRQITVLPLLLRTKLRSQRNLSYYNTHTSDISLAGTVRSTFFPCILSDGKNRCATFYHILSLSDTEFFSTIITSLIRLYNLCFQRAVKHVRSPLFVGKKKKKKNSICIREDSIEKSGSGNFSENDTTDYREFFEITHNFIQWKDLKAKVF